MSVGSFNIHGLMSASVQMERLAHQIRDGRDSSQVQFAAQVQKEAEEAKARVRPADPAEGPHKVDEDKRRDSGAGVLYESQSQEQQEDSDEEPDDGPPDLQIDILA